MCYEEAARFLQEKLKGRDPDGIFLGAKRCLECAEKEGKVDDLLKDFPGLYEVVITFDRASQALHNQ